MAIDINGNCVVFNGEALCSTPAGAEYNGVICHQGFIDCRVFGGTVSGYSVRGNIDKFPFASDSNSTDVAEMAVSVDRASGQSSGENGYQSGGYRSPPTFPVRGTNCIQKFPFSSDSPASDVADLTKERHRLTGQSSKIQGYGYSSGGYCEPNPSPPIRVLNEIDKFPFSSDANATDVGDMTGRRADMAGHSSQEHGYSSGGSIASASVNVIERFPFSSDSPATDIGDLLSGPWSSPSSGIACASGQSSFTHGYSSGGGDPSGQYLIMKFPFSSGTTTTNIGNFSTLARTVASGQSSTTEGYVSGGFGPRFPPVTNRTQIDKFPFASDTNGSCVGDLSAAICGATGNQV